MATTQTALQQMEAIIKAATEGKDFHERAQFHKDVARLVPLSSEYNGWPNYETWAMALYLGNDQETDTQTRLHVDAFNDPHDSADALKAWVESTLPDDMAALRIARLAPNVSYSPKARKAIEQNLNYALSDFIRAGLESVRWSRIVESFREE